MDGSKQLDLITINNVTLTLASWTPDSYYPSSYEIGHRTKDKFTLIQFSLNHKLAFDIVKRLVTKGRTPRQIQSLLFRLEREKSL